MCFCAYVHQCKGTSDIFGDITLNVVNVLILLKILAAALSSMKPSMLLLFVVLCDVFLSVLLALKASMK